MHTGLPRRAWYILVAGMLAAYAAGAAVALWVMHSGGWRDGTAWDVSVMHRTHRPLPGWLDVVLLIIPWFGTNITIFAVLIPLSFWLRRRGRMDLVTELAVVSIGNYVLNFFVKVSFGRPRPSLWPRRGEYTWSSYPSGHAIAMMSVLVIIAWLMYRERGVKWPFVVWAVLIVPMVYSRIYLGVHWPTDVVAGLLMGVIWAIAVWLALRGEGRRHDPAPLAGA
ncbi:MAG TPA: phosphatase PAP2 family protein [Gemmatimonadaceae bacterium]